MTSLKKLSRNINRVAFDLTDNPDDCKKLESFGIVEFMHNYELFSYKVSWNWTIDQMVRKANKYKIKDGA